jgi:hypothetical protein
VEILPSLNFRRKTFPIQNKVGSSIIPGRRIKMLEEQLKYSDTFENRKTLADEYYKIGDFTKAMELYKNCLVGIHEDDSTAKLGLAKCYYEAKKYEDAWQLLEAIKNKEGYFDNLETQGLYLKIIEEVETKEAVINEYEKIMVKKDKLEFEYMYGKYLCRINQVDRGREIFNDIVSKGDQLKNLGVYFDKTWIKEAQRELRMMEKTK